LVLSCRPQSVELDDDALTVMVTEFELLLAYVVEPP